MQCRGESSSRRPQPMPLSPGSWPSRRAPERTRTRSVCRSAARPIRIAQRIVKGDFAGLLKDMKGLGIEVIELC